MTEMTQAADTASMRAEADQLKASVREDNRSLYERHRRAVQLEHEAALLDEAELSLAELTGARQCLERLRQEARDAKDAERQAEDKRDAEKSHRDLRLAEEQRADADPAATAEQQEDAAIRAHKAQRRLDLAESALAVATGAHERAKAAAGDWQAHAEQLGREHAELDRKARNPGTAPNMPALAPGVATLDDMDPDARKMLGLYVALLASVPSGSDRAAPAQLANGDPRLGLAGQDPKQFRYLRTPNGVQVIPPARRP